MSALSKLKSPNTILHASPNQWPTPRERFHLLSIIQDLEGLAKISDFTTTSSFVNPTSVAINATATATATQMIAGVITSTSTAATAITTPTAASILALLTGATAGSSFELVIDNSAGASTVTLTLDASITAPAGAITGGNTLTVTTTHKIGKFLFYFTSATAAVVYRVA